MSPRIIGTFILVGAVIAGCGTKERGVTRDSVVADSTKAVVDSAKAISLPPSVAAVATDGEDLYDQVKAGDWGKASALLDSLDAAVKTLPPNEPRIRDERAKLGAVVGTLRRAVGAKDARVALEESNRLTYLAAKMTDPYHPTEPSAVPLLDYYGRELEIWAARGDRAKLSSTVRELKATWDGLRPTVQANGGGAVAAKTDSLVSRIVAAKTPAEQGKLATPFLDVVDELEKVFVK